MYNGINLVDIDCPPSSSQKFARKIMEILFTEKEMMDGTFYKKHFSKSKSMTEKPLLSPSRQELIMSKLQALIVCKLVSVYTQIICMLASICCISVSYHPPVSE